MGTPDYMAPEQALDAHSVDIRADIYSLGCTLYALLAGGPPFPTGSLMQKLLWHKEKEPTALEELRSDLPPGLAEVCRKAMAKQPEDRFAIPAELAAALASFCSPPLSIPPAIQAAAQRPALDLDSIDFSFLSIGDSLPTRVQTLDTECPSDPGPTPLPSPTLELTTESTPLAALPASPTEPLDTLPEVLPADIPLVLPADRPSGRSGSESTRRDSGRRSRKRRSPRDKSDKRSGRLTTILTVLGGLLLVALLSSGGWLKSLWPARQSSADTPDEIRRIEGHTDIIYGIAFSPDGKRAVSSAKDRTVCVWDLDTGALDARLEGFSGTVNSVAWSPTDNLILMGGQSRNGQDNRSVRLWDVDPGKTVRQFPLEGHTTSVLCVAFSPDGKQALTGGGLRNHGDLAVRLWDVEQRQQIGQLAGHEDYVFRVVFSPDGKRAASCSNDGTVRLWDLADRKEAHCFRSKARRILCLAFSPDGKQLAGGGEDSCIHIWSLDTFAESAALAGHERPLFGVAFLPGGKRLLSASADKTLRLWDLAGGQEVQRFTGHTDIITNLAVSPDGTQALTCSQDRTVRLWRLPP
jgi:hypothetical protein